MGYTKKTWTYLSDSSQLTMNIRLRTKDYIALDLHIPVAEDNPLVIECKKQVQILLQSNLPGQKVEAPRYQLAEDTSTALLNREPVSRRRFDSGLWRKNIRRGNAGNWYSYRNQKN